ncbi:MAG TPA: hypothetical protein VLM40_09395, partial [Gemmata sp.]|nr:hypothetical protein [Gemmata sp.]
MHRALILGVLCGSLLPLCHSVAAGTAQAQRKTRIAPASNGVEIDEIYIARRTALGAVKEADLTNMQLGLWFSADWEAKDGRSTPLIHLQELSAIEDDTGRVLTTEKRLKEIEQLRGEVRGNTWKSFGRKQGPVLSLLLDAPARGAGKIKSVKGKAQVTITKPITLTFKDLAAVNGKILEHSDFKDLAAMKLRFSVENKDGSVSAKLSAPVNYASPWNRGRLQNWDVMDGGKRISLSSEGRSTEG